MYDKVKKSLESMAYGFRECERVEFKNGVSVTNGFSMEDHDIYIEISDKGDINVWRCSTGEYMFEIKKQPVYIMMFQLAWIIENS